MQRDLAHVGRLAGHVRPGEQHDLPPRRVEVDVVGHEASRRQQPLDDRVARGHERAGGRRRGRAAASSPGRAATSASAGERVELGERARGRLQRVEVRARRASRSARKRLVLGLAQALLGAEHLRLLRPQLGRDVALGGGQRLAALVVRGHARGMRAA